MTPSEELLTLFHDLVLNVWDRKQADARAQMDAMHKALSVLTDRKNTLMDRYLDGKIDQSTYDEQNERLGSEIAQARAELRNVEVIDEQIEELLEFADSVLRDPVGLWMRASLDPASALAKGSIPYRSDLCGRQWIWNRLNSLNLQHVAGV